MQVTILVLAAVGGIGEWSVSSSIIVQGHRPGRKKVLLENI